jgi:hypothetical protein
LRLSVDRPMLGRMPAESPILHSAEVNQAAGMVSVQANCGIDEALASMTERAKFAGLSLDEIAAGVVDRSIWFTES